MCKCLYCYKPLKEGEIDYHKACARKIFESTTVPALPYTRANIKELAWEIITASTTVTGVQAKLSLDISRGHAGEPQRFTIVGLWGRFILKPQTDRFDNLPENEDLTMHMAEAAGILYNIKYAEYRGAKMFTYGGIVLNSECDKEELNIDRFDFISTIHPYEINIPNLTYREASYLNQILDIDDKEKELSSQSN